MLTRKATSRPTGAEAARRLVVLQRLVGRALRGPPLQLLLTQYERWNAEEQASFKRTSGKDRDRFCWELEDDGLWQSLSPREAEFAQTTSLSVRHDQRLDMCWRLEAAQCLLWALHLLPSLPPFDTVAPRGLLKGFAVKDHRAFTRAVRLRSDKEIKRARRLAELWHWRSRTRQLLDMGMEIEPDEDLRAAGIHSYYDIIRWTALNVAQKGYIAPCIEEDFPARGKPYRSLSPEEWQEVHSIAVERHLAFNWLCGYAPGKRWDETPTNT